MASGLARLWEGGIIPSRRRRKASFECIVAEAHCHIKGEPMLVPRSRFGLGPPGLHPGGLRGAPSQSEAALLTAPMVVARRP
jgi:hypothetical protein